MAFYFVSTFAIAQTPTKQPALRLSRTKNLHFAKAPFPGFSAIAMPINYDKFVPSSADEKEPRVISSTTYFQSLIAPILPYGFQYAIIDDSTGLVLYHSQDDKAFAENFYSETEYNNEIIAAIRAGKEFRWGQTQSTSLGMQFSINGKYHAELTNFHVLPLKTVPWSLITLYPKELAHSVAIESGISSFFSFLLYTFIFYLIIELFHFFNRILTRHDDLNCAWLWPVRMNKQQYSLVSWLLVPFCFIYLFGIYSLNGWELTFYLLISIPAQLAFIYYSFAENQGNGALAK